MGDSSAESDVEEYSRIEQPSIITQLRAILEEYPHDGQIIKELIQNADDAKANELKILYEGRHLNQESEDGEQPKKYQKFFQAPALVFYNDAEFTAEDWRGIKMIYNSIKAEDPLKIGRFGLGFKSVFHITDFPCIISGDRILFIDPDEDNPCKVCVTVKLQKLHKSKHVNVKDCLKSLQRVFGFSKATLTNGQFDGTMFWFPLRREKSRLSSNIYSEVDVMNLLNAFQSDAHNTLLFLKHLHCIKLYVNVPKSPDASDLCTTEMKNINFGRGEEFFKVDIDGNGEFLTNRLEFMEKLSKSGKLLPQVSETFSSELIVRSVSRKKKDEDHEEKSHWFVTVFLNGEDASMKDLKTLVESNALFYHPLVGIAHRITDTSGGQLGGHIFCFQPLPHGSQKSLTGLPVHVNAFFAVSQNRRHLKWPSADQKQCHMSVDKSIEWNLLLVSEVLPGAYVQLVKELVKLSKEKNNHKDSVMAVYNAIPDVDSVDEKWKPLVDRFLFLLKNYPLLFTKSNGGKWISADSAIVLSADIAERKEMCTVLSLLESEDVNLVVLPENVIRTLESNTELEHVTPMFLSRFLRSNNSYRNLEENGKEDLFLYLSNDHENSLLSGIELLPLSDGTFVTFSQGPLVFFADADEVELFPGQGRHFVARHVYSEKGQRKLEMLTETDGYQLQCLDWNSMTDLLYQTVQGQFQETKWISSEQLSDHVWRHQIKNLWKLVSKHHVNIANTEKFSNLPLLPISSDNNKTLSYPFSLWPLSEHHLKLSEQENLGNDKNVLESLELLSVKVMYTIPQNVPTKLAERHIFTSENVDQLLKELTDVQINNFNHKSSDENKTVLLKYFAAKLIIVNMSPQLKDVLRQLDIWKEYSSFQTVKAIVSAAKNDKIYKDGKYPVRYPFPVIRVSSSSERDLAKNIGMTEVDKVDLAKKTLEAMICHGEIYSKHDVKEFMTWLLQKKIHKNSQVLSLCTKIKFIECADEKMHAANELFDPSDQVLNRFFSMGNTSRLPRDPDLDLEIILPRLREIGLRKMDDVTFEDILIVCENIKDTDLMSMAYDLDALLQILENKHHVIDREVLSEIPFLKIPKAKPASYPNDLPFYAETSREEFLKPSVLKSAVYANLIGSNSPVIDSNGRHNVENLFKWNSPPDLDAVLNHLALISERYSSKKKASYINITVQIYEWLAKSQRVEVLRNKVQTKFQQIRFIWTGDGFESAENMYIDCSHEVNLAPFLFQLPQELNHLKDFFVSLGCQEIVTREMYISTLRRINDNKLTSLSASKLRHLSIAVLNVLKNNFPEKLSDFSDEILVPVETLNLGTFLMKRASLCTYCDRPWIKQAGFFNADDENELIYVYPDVSNETAEAVGVKSLTEQMLLDADALEEWGQEEPLTRRLKYLLKEGYIDGISIPKELLQNADDAGASKLWMLYDERENEESMTNLLSREMSQVQGPALWVYNDAEFSEADFKNLTKISGATKEPNAGKIGKFGLGFCSVYNLTDVPSILSGENLIIFDPHTKYLDKALPGRSPGIRMNFKKIRNKIMLKSCQHQFEPYNDVFGCKLFSGNEYFKGTLFRFPLRNKVSEISDTIYTKSEVLKLLEKIVGFSANMLIFSQNVKDFKFFHLPKSVKNPKEKKLFFRLDKKRALFPSNLIGMNTVLQHAATLKKCQSLKENPLNIIEEVTITRTQMADTDLAKAITAKSKKSKTKTNWLVSWATGTGVKALEITKKEEGALPLAAVAVPMDKEEKRIFQLKDLQEGFYSTGHFFFFLPLPIEHSLNFHINGPFAVTNDRRHLRHDSAEDKNRSASDWNDCIFEDSVLSSFIFLLKHIKHFCNEKHYSFCELWPTSDQTNVEVFFKSFYKKIVTSENLDIFESSGSWHTLPECIFIDPDFRAKEIGGIAYEILMELRHGSNLHKTVVDMPKRYHSILMETENQVECSKIVTKSTITDKDFFMRYFFPNIKLFGTTKTWIARRNQLLKYAILLEDQEVDTWLKKNDSIPTQPYETLHKPKELICVNKLISDLFMVSEEKFLSHDLAEDERIIKHMYKLGMKCDSITDEDLIDRAKTIMSLNMNCSCCAKDRCVVILRYLDNKISLHENALQDFMKFMYLPLHKKPKSWQFDWEGTNLEITGRKVCSLHNEEKTYVFAKAKQLYHPLLKELVGCVEHILDCSPFQKSIAQLDEVLEKLGIRNNEGNVETITVIRNLKNIVASYNPEKISMIETNKILNITYRVLNKRCKKEKAFIKRELSNENIIFTGKIFTNPAKVALIELRDCDPYLFGIKRSGSELENCKELCNVLEIQDHFRPNIVAKVLQENVKQRRLNDLERKRVIALLRCLYDVMTKYDVPYNQIPDGDVQAIFIPDESWIMRDSTTMCFNDFELMPKTDSMIYVHDEISKSWARCFGVKPKKRQKLREISDDISDDFYQEEPLTTRLKNIVEGYSCDISIFKELIQNADDAGASEIHFINDEVTHGTETLLDKCSEPLQGPALCVFNDSSFTKADLVGIQKLGRGSKSNDSSKTGQYGVGFNVVYNLTDVPSFLTKGEDIEGKETLCIFDPHARYIPDTERQKPGKRYRDLWNIRQFHKNVMDGYHECLFPDKSKGTMFRFPLRTEVMAKYSEIKKDTFNSKDVKKLLDQLKQESPELILFLKNIRRVKISQNTNKGIETEYDLHIEVSERQSPQLEQFNCQRKRLLEDKRLLLCHPQEIMTLNLKMIQNNTPLKKYNVVQVVGFKTNTQIPDTVKSMVQKEDFKLTPQGSVAVCLDGGVEPKAYCFLPLQEKTGLPVFINGHFALDHETRKRLWRSENGHGQEHCTKTIWNKFLLEQVVTPAYVKLIRNLQMLETLHKNELQLAESIKNNLHVFLGYLPVLKDITDFYWKELIKYLYKGLVSDGTEFLPILKVEFRHKQFKAPETDMKPPTKEMMASFQWTAFDNGTKFDVYQFTHEVRMKEETESLISTICDIGMRVVYVTEDISLAMEFAEVPVKKLTPRFVIDFLKSYVLTDKGCCNLKINQRVDKTKLLNIHNVEILLKYCLEDKEYFLKNCQELPLFLTQDVFLRCTKDGIYVTKHQLFTELNSIYLHRSLVYLLQHEDFVSSNCGLKSFTIKDFTKYFKSFAKRSKKYGSAEILSGKCVRWNRADPSEKWISDFWSFLIDCWKLESPDEALFKFLQPISDFALLPVTDMESSFLLPVSQIKCVLNSDGCSSNFKEVLDKVNFLRLDTELLKELKKNILPLVSNVLDALELIECFSLNAEKMHMVQLTDQGVVCILDYFSDNIKNLSSNKNITDKLRKLPIYMTSYGERIPLSSGKRIVIVPKDIPVDGQEVLAKENDIILLKDTGERHSHFFSLLDISILTSVKVYTDIIIPGQTKLDRHTFYLHLMFINKHQEIKRDKGLLKLLQNTAFVETVGSRMKTLKELFDSQNNIFKLLCSENLLLPAELERDELLPFLKTLGLQSIMTLKLYIQFAGEICDLFATDGITAENRRKSSALTISLLEEDETFYKRENLEELSKIKFVVSENVSGALTNIKEQACLPRTPISINGSVLFKQANTCWTCSKILPKSVDKCLQAKPGMNLKIKKLGIKSQIEFDDLVKHCLNLGPELCDKLNNPKLHLNKKTINNVMTSIYTLFQEFLKKTPSTPCPQKLRQVPLIYFPEEAMVYQPSFVVNSCNEKEEIPPYLKKAPVQAFGSFLDVFLLLGTSKEVSYTNYCRVLSALKNNSADEELLPPEYMDAKKSTGFLLECIDKAESTVVDLKDDCLFLLTEKKTLIKAEDVVVCDNPYLRKRLDRSRSLNLTYFADCKEIDKKTDMVLDCFKKLKEDFQPKMLSSIVCENIVKPFGTAHNQHEANQLERFLHSLLFIHGCIRLARHVKKKKSDQWNPENDPKNISQAIKSVCVKEVTNLKTILEVRDFKDGSFSECKSVPESKESKSVHIEEEGQVMVCFQRDDSNWYNDVKDKITSYIDRCVFQMEKDDYTTMLQMLDQRKDPQKIPDVLDKKHVEQYVVDDSVVEEDFAEPGTYVPEKYHEYLDNDYGIFNKYDFKCVAYEIEDPFLEDDGINDQSKSTYVFAKIIKRVGTVQANILFQMYEIDIGRGEYLEVPAFKLFKFKRGTRLRNSVALKASVNTSGENIAITSEEYVEDEPKMTLKEAYAEVRNHLKEAWSKSESEKRHIVKRLHLKWHPDKNPDNTEFCTKVFQYLQQCIKRLTDGKDLLDDTEENTSSSGPKGHHTGAGSGDRSGSRNGSESSGPKRDRGRWEWYEEFCHRDWRRYWRHRKQSWRDHDEAGFSFQRREKYHYYEEARRWQMQADSDLAQARLRFVNQDHTRANTWVCFMCHQAAENSLTAAWYAEDANEIYRIKYNHNLVSIASGLNSDLLDPVRRLTIITGDHKDMLYPSGYRFSRGDTDSVLELADKILKIVDKGLK